MMMKTCNLKACQLNDTSANIVSRCQPCIALANDDVLTALPDYSAFFTYKQYTVFLTNIDNKIDIGVIKAIHFVNSVCTIFSL